MFLNVCQLCEVPSSAKISGKLVVALSARIVAATVAAVCCTPAQCQWQPDTRNGDFEFNMPTNWTRVERPGGTMLVPPDVPRGQIAFIQLLAPQELTTDLRTWFNRAWADLQRATRVVDGGTIEAGHHANGYDFLSVEARVSNPQLTYAVLVFTAAQVGSRVESYLFLSNATQLYFTHREGLKQFTDSLRFAGVAPLSSATLPSGGAGLDGVYLGYKIRGLAGLRSHVEYLVFFPDRNVVRYLPEQGLEGFDFRAALRDSRDYCGRYSANEDEVTILWADNNREVASRRGGVLKIGGDSYFPVSKANGLSLEGTYRREGADLARYGITFTRDGRFTENGVLSLLAYRGGNDAPGRGQYRIGNNTIVLAYVDGRTVRFSFYVRKEDENGAPPGAIVVNTYTLVR